MKNRYMEEQILVQKILACCLQREPKTCSIINKWTLKKQQSLYRYIGSKVNKVGREGYRGASKHKKYDVILFELVLEFLK